VVQRRERLRFALETRQTLGILCECGGQQLDRDVAIEAPVARTIDFAL